MTAEQYRQQMAAATTEGQLQADVRDLCRTVGAQHYHTHDSRRSEEGFPDSTIVAGDRLIFAELKTERRKVPPAQLAWIEALSRCLCQACGAPAVTVRVWRPSHWLSGEIEAVIRGRA